MIRLSLLLVFSLMMSPSLPAKEDVIRDIFQNALHSEVAYENLRILCETTEGRLSGTPEAAAAVEFTRQIMLGMELDSVYLQEVMVPNWQRGEPEEAKIISARLGTADLTALAFGLSVGTGPDGLTAPVIELNSTEQLEALGREKLEGKIVFFNRHFDHSHYNTFDGYGATVGARFRGPAMAAEYGAVAAVVRSVTSANHDYAHTGVTRFVEGGPNIPALALSPVSADKLSNWLGKDPGLNLYLRNTSHRLPDVLSYNVIGEIRGSEYPNEIITVGGHLDAWDNTQGAHDDGAGCMQSIDVLRIFRELGIQPKRTLRAVMFMDEEIAQRGGNKYAEVAHAQGEQHYFAIESDRGAFTPRGFSVDSDDARLQAVKSLKPYFEPYGIHEIFAGFSGVDIVPLKNFYDDVTLAGLHTDTQRYFDLHHAASDTFDQVNRREMQLGTAAMAALIYLVDVLDLLVIE